MLVLSANFWHIEALSARNRQLMITAITRARSYGCPWLLGVDFQTQPETLHKQFPGILELAQARISAPCDATFRPDSGCAKTMDYFIVSDTLKDLVRDVRVDLGCEASRHRAVLVILRAPRQNTLLEALRRPAVFPRH